MPLPCFAEGRTLMRRQFPRSELSDVLEEEILAV